MRHRFFILTVLKSLSSLFIYFFVCNPLFFVYYCVVLFIIVLFFFICYYSIKKNRYVILIPAGGDICQVMYIYTLQVCTFFFIIITVYIMTCKPAVTLLKYSVFAQMLCIIKICIMKHQTIV